MKKVAVFLMIVPAAIISVAMGGWDGYAPVAEAQLTVKVVDDVGSPVGSALISLGFFNMRNPEAGTRVECYTDPNGYAVLIGQTSGELAYWISKDGYYDSNGGYKKWMKIWRPPSSNIENGRWQPWNPTLDVVLKKISDPVPMYVKSVRTDIPAENKPIGFDLEKGDWVLPYGAGAHSDILFKLYRDLNSWQDYRSSLTLTFPNKEDGIKNVYASHKEGPKYAMPYSAPQDGYSTNLFFKESYRNYQEEREDQNYVFRVRTVLDGNGEIKSALYGKIHGNILFDVRGSETASLLFKYYLNSTSNDRNIEFDPDKNLFGGRDRFAP